MIRDLTLNKQQSELLASSLQQWNLLAGDARASAFRKRAWELQQHFSMDKGLCPDIKGLFDDLGLEYESTQWKLFIDAYLYSIKAVLLHIGNVLPSFPTGHSVTLKETSENLTFIMDRISTRSSMGLMCRFDSCGYSQWIAKWLYQDHVFPLQIGQQNEVRTLYQNYLATTSNI